jgi:hypothetical protein
VLELGLHIDHTAIYRWVHHYAPELEKRCRPHLKATNDSWRVDETYKSEKGVDVPLSRCGFSGKDAGISLEPEARYGSGQTLLLESACCATYQHSSSHHSG